MRVVVAVAATALLMIFSVPNVCATTTVRQAGSQRAQSLPARYSGTFTTVSLAQFTIQTSAPTNLNISTCGSTIDTMLQIRYFSSGNWIHRQCDDCGSCGGVNSLQASLVEAIPDATTVYVNITGYAGAMGPWHFSVSSGPSGSAGVCVTQSNIRLTGENCNASMGRVEVLRGGQWGTVCDDRWSASAAQVVCRQLGFTNGDPITSMNHLLYGNAYPDAAGSPPILMDDVTCTGNEASLFDCPFNSAHNCRHVEDSGVICHNNLGTAYQGAVTCGQTLYGNTVTGAHVIGTDAREHFYNFSVTVPTNMTFSTCSSNLFDSYLRLYDTSGTEIGHDDDGCSIGSTSAIIRSDQLLPGENYTILVEGFGSNEGPYVLQVSCGNLSSVIPPDPTPVGPQVRLADGTSEYNGRVEIFHQGQWGTVCDDGWSDTNAQVVCAELGYSGGRIPMCPATHPVRPCVAPYGPGSGRIWLDNVHCSGRESSIENCNHNLYGRHNCVHREDAGVICDPWNVTTTPASVHGLRLVSNTRIPGQGRVEVNVNNQWGTVCDDLWGPTDAQVVCRQLGFSGGIARPRAFFGQGSGPILYDNVRCSGNEATLQECPKQTSIHNCQHNEDAGVECSLVRLWNPQTNAADSRSGILQIIATDERSTTWKSFRTGTDNPFSNTEASVACRMLGYTSGSVASVPDTTSTASLYAGFNCTGIESSVFDCHGSRSPNGGTSCAAEGSQCTCPAGNTVFYGAGERWYSMAANPGGSTPCTNAQFGDPVYGTVKRCICVNSAPTVASITCNNGNTSTGIRLVGGSSIYEGRLEIFTSSGVWGTVCDDYWSSADAAVVCRQLGAQGGRAYSRAAYGEGDGPIVLDDVRCVGDEPSIMSCPAQRTHNCQHVEDAGVKCNTVRLVGGPTNKDGRVQILGPDGSWHGICADNSWDVTDAQILCSELGFSGGRPSNNYGRSPLAVITNVNCSGDEDSIMFCPRGSDMTLSCQAHAGVTCGQSVRLVDGTNDLEGRVEVFANGNWGSVCDDGWSNVDAGVVCRQLGYADGVARRDAAFGEGTGRIMLDDVTCDGSEVSLLQCGNSGIGEHNCVHSEDAGAVCSNIRLVPEQNLTDPNFGSRLVTHGIVEVWANNSWAPVCAEDRRWTNSDATTVCRQLGLGDGNASSTGPMSCRNDYDLVLSGQMSGQLPSPEFEGCAEAVAECSARPDTLQLHCRQACDTCSGSSGYSCSGAEGLLSECPHTVGPASCHIFAVATCNAGTSDRIRLAGGSNESEGRVELFYNNRWGTVCDDFWDNRDAQVVCRQLGYSGGTATSRASFGQGSSTSPIYLDDVQCTGTENSLVDCPAMPIGQHNCRHSEDAGVVCTAPIDQCLVNRPATTQTPIPSVPYRLMNHSVVSTTTLHAGRVEVFHNGRWGTICDDRFTDRSATVLCRSLFPNTYIVGTHVRTTRSFGAGRISSPIWLDDVICRGNESTLGDCPNLGWGHHNCAHYEDVAVSCSRPRDTPATTSSPDSPPPADGPRVRLVGGPYDSEGRVEFWNGTVWGTVCDHGFGYLDAKVVCRELGFRNGFARPKAQFGSGSSLQPILLNNVSCSGNEGSLSDCNAVLGDGNTCFHSDDVGVVCRSVGLQGGSRDQGSGWLNTSGRVIVKRGNVIGTVCGCGFGNQDAQVVCRELGFGDGIATNSFGPGNNAQPIFYDQLMCHGDENSLSSCENAADDARAAGCTHQEDAGVQCFEGVRLAGTNSNYSAGRLEVLVNGEWSTVCSSSWSDRSATVACHQLGFRRGRAVQANTLFSAGVGPILDKVDCDGMEQSILQCSAVIGTNNCRHTQDAGVVCSDPVGPVVPRATFPPTVSAGPPPPTSSYEIGDADGGRLSLVGNVSSGDYVTGLLQMEVPRGSVNGVNYYSNGLVCANNFNEMAATVSCIQMGFHSGTLVSKPEGFDNSLLSTVTSVHNVHCDEFKPRLLWCDKQILVPGGPLLRCRGDRVFLSCKLPENFDVRLRPKPGLGMPSNDDIVGIVEFFSTELNQWGTICDDGLEDESTKAQYVAQAICSQLGFEDGQFDHVHYSPGDLHAAAPILMDELTCPGSANGLADCNHRNIGDHNCGSHEKLVVRCLRARVAAPTSPVAAPTTPGPNGSGGNDGGSNSAVVIGGVMGALVVLGTAVGLYIRSKRAGAAALSATYQRVQNNNAASPIDDDEDDDDQLIVADDVEQDRPVGGTISLGDDMSSGDGGGENPYTVTEDDA